MFPIAQRLYKQSLLVEYAPKMVNIGPHKNNMDFFPEVR